MPFNILSLPGLQRFKNHISRVLTSKTLDDSVTGQYTFQAKPLFNLDTTAIDNLFEGNLIFFNVNDNSQIGSIYLKDTDNLYFDIETAPPVSGYDFVSMEYDPASNKYHLWYIPLTNPVASSSTVFSYINQGVIPNTKNNTDLVAPNTYNNITEIPRLYTKNVTRIDTNSNIKNVTIIHQLDGTNLTDANFRQTKITTPPKIINCEKLKTLSFYNCANLVSFDSSDINTSNLRMTQNTFSGCTSLNSVNLKIPKATDARYMFTNCTSLVNIPDLDTKSVIQLENMFEGCSNLETIAGLNLTNASKSSYITDTFKGCTSLREVHIDFGNNTNVSNLFNGLTFGANQMINLYVKNIPQSVRSAIQSNYGTHVTIIDE